MRALCGAGLVLLIVFAAGAAALRQSIGPAAAAGDCTTDPTLDSEEQLFLQLINNYRAQNGLQPLAISYTLTKASQWKSDDLAANNYFAHDDLTRTWDQRIRDCGYGYNAWMGENIAAGNSGAQATFDQWRNSPGHNANMLGANYTAIGIGRAYSASSTYRWYWTTDFGSVSDGWPGSTPTATATATRTATPTATTVPPTSTSTATPTGPGLHVGDIDATVSGSSPWAATANVWVHDATHKVITGATVYGAWSGSGVMVCVTNSSGRCPFNSPSYSSGVASTSFSVLSISRTGTYYDATANHDPDGSSDGTTIVVTAPSAPTATATPTATGTPSPTVPADHMLHVGDIDATATGTSSWTGIANVRVHDPTHKPIAGVTVYGWWSGDAVTSCVTNTSGRCAIASSAYSAGVSSATFTVSTLSRPGTAYDAAANHDPDGDSDGTAIVVDRPADSATPTSTPTPTATPNPVPADHMLHVGDIDATAMGASSWSGIANVWVYDPSDKPIAGVTVYGWWSGNTVTSCVTNTSGRCAIASSAYGVGVSSATFTVSTLSRPGTTYDAAANHDPDGDSDGTTITITN